MSLLHVLVLSGVLEPQLTLEEIYDAWRQLPAERSDVRDGGPLAAMTIEEDEGAAASGAAFW